MPTFIVKEIIGKPRLWGSPPMQNFSYTLKGDLDGEEQNVQINSKVKTNNEGELVAMKQPFVGESIPCEITKDDPIYGKTIKRAMLPPQSSQGTLFDNPEKQAMIVRQNALGNAVLFLSEKAKLEKKADELTTDNVLLIAAKFAKFSMGELQPKPPVNAEDE